MAREELGRYAFEALRHLPMAGEPRLPVQPADVPRRPILIAGANFGCGSSREGAVWALMGLGLRCVNRTELRRHLLQQLLPERGSADRARRGQAGGSCGARGRRHPADGRPRGLRVSWPDGASVPFRDRRAQTRILLAGLDAIGLTLRDADLIAAWQAADRSERPWIWELQHPQRGRIDLLAGAGEAA